MGKRRDPGGSIRSTNSNQEPILTPCQLGGSDQGCGRSQYHKGGYVQAMVHQGPLGKVQEGALGLAPQSVQFHLQVSPQII